MTRLNEIQKTFKKNGIILKEKVDNHKRYHMTDSVTNQVMKIEDTNGEQYLIRINGK